MSDLQRAAFSFQGTDSDMAHLRRALRQSLRTANHPPAATPRRRLLNLACGRADETGVLAEIFGEGAERLEILGADLRAPEIEEARARWSAPAAGVHTEFQSGDGLKLLDALEHDQQFEVAFLRHQNFWNGAELWQGMFDRSLHRLTDDGLLVITSYFDTEHRMACEALQRLGAVLLTDYRNPASRLLSAQHRKSVDRHIAVFRKSHPA